MGDVFDALAHPVRRRILKLLGKKPMNAGEIADHFDLAKPTLSGHFSILKTVRLISSQRLGTTILYSLNMSVLEEATAAIMEIAAIQPRSGKE
jgi:DNA-binding transcriptional ArsR family regulator